MDIREAEKLVRGDYLNEYLPILYYSNFIDTAKKEAVEQRLKPFERIRRIEERYPDKPFLKEAVKSSKYLRTVNGFTSVINRKLDECRNSRDRNSIDMIFYIANFAKDYIRALDELH